MNFLRRFSTRENLDIPLLTLARIGRSISGGVIGVAFPYCILATLHYGSLLMGVIFICARIATAVLGFLSGLLADSWGKRNTLIVISALRPLSAFVVYMSTSLWWIMAAAMAGGFSATGSLGGGVSGAVQPVQNAVLAELTPSCRAKDKILFSLLVHFRIGDRAWSSPNESHVSPRCLSGRIGDFVGHDSRLVGPACLQHQAEDRQVEDEDGHRKIHVDWNA